MCKLTELLQAVLEWDQLKVRRCDFFVLCAGVESCIVVFQHTLYIAVPSRLGSDRVDIANWVLQPNG